MSTIQELIQRHLPPHVHEIAQKFVIPENFLISESNLITMILESPSLSTDNTGDKDKQSWFDLLPLMKDDQLVKLRDILIREKTKLKELEEKYDKKKQDIKQRYLNKWEEKTYEQHMDSLKDKESAHQKRSEQEAEDLLEQL